MMEENILQLYPGPIQETPLLGLYLKSDLRGHARELGRPFVYTNFIRSLDGRVAVPHPSGEGMVVPEGTVNPRDWRLFQELAVQSDVLITTGRYLRDYAEERAQEILSIYDDPRFTDLATWRAERGLNPYPALAVVSASLDFAIPPVLSQGERDIVLVTTRRSDPDRLDTLKDQVRDVIIAGDERVDGRQMIDGFSRLGYTTIYSSSGPKILHMLASADVLDRLYLTTAHRLMGGSPFSSILEGPLLDPIPSFQLLALYLDPHALDGDGQMFAVYDRAA
jgi:riboflavin biosynthesis pyrimidine reductase